MRINFTHNYFQPPNFEHNFYQTSHATLIHKFVIQLIEITFWHILNEIFVKRISLKQNIKKVNKKIEKRKREVNTRQFEL